VASNFPTSLDNFTNPSSGNTLDSPSHSLQHSDINDAVEAMQRKVGVGTAVAGSASAGQVLTISAAGTSTWSTPTPGGLVQVVPTSVAVGSGSGSVDANGAVTFSGASSISLNGCFNSTFDNYKLLFYCNAASATANINFRFRTTSDDTGTNYYAASSGVNWSNTAVNNNAITQSSFGVSRVVTGDPGYTSFNFDCIRPYVATYSTLLGGQSMGIVGGPAHNHGAFWSVTSTQFTGFSIFMSTGTFGGSIRVYGYKN
jgi:hypothetical protein